MSKPMHISEVMHQLVLNNPDDPWAQILRHCPFIQIAMLKKNLDTVETAGADITKMMEASVTPELGQNIDVSI